MKQKSLEQLEYSKEDIEKLIYADIAKLYGNVNKAKINIGFRIEMEDQPGDYRAELPLINVFKGANVSVDMTPYKETT